jgi:hypothetical protein
MKSIVAFFVAVTLSFFSIPVLRADPVDPSSPLSIPMAEKAFVPEKVPVAVTYTAGLTSASVTTLSGNPLPRIMDGSSVSTSASLSSGKVVIAYDVRTAGTSSGLTIDFDNYATAGKETADLSALSNLKVGLSGTVRSVNVRFEDADGNTGVFQLTQVSSTERFWKLNLKLLDPGVDRSRIRSIHFYVMQGNVASTKRTGTFAVRLNGLDTLKPVMPQLAVGTPTLFNQNTVTLSGTKEAYSSVYVNGIRVALPTSATTWTAQVKLPLEGNNVITLVSKSMLGVASKTRTVTLVRDTVLPTGSVKINNGAAMTDSRDVALQLTAGDALSGVDQVRFSVDGGENWTDWENYLATRAISLLGEDGTKEVRYQVRDKAGNIKLFTDTIVLELPLIPVPPQPSIVTVLAGDRRLFVHERLADGTLGAEVAYVSKGVNWSPSSIGSVQADAVAEFVKWYKTDFQLMAQMGVNTIRVYHDFGTGADAIKILDEMWRNGIKVIMTVDSPAQGGSANLANISAVVNAYKNHPAILMWAVGNEWDINKYYGTFSTLEQAAAFTEQAAQLIKSLDANHPVTTLIADVNIPGVHPLSDESYAGAWSGPYTKDIVNTLVPSVDVWGTNLYRGSSFQDAMAQWASISNEPVYIGEFGADSYDHRISAENQAMQAQMNAGLWDELYFNLSAERTNGVALGALAFEWNDEWWKSGSASSHTVSWETNYGQPDLTNDEEWFGIVDINRNVKQVYTTMQSRFLNGQSAVQLDATPVITVTSQGPSGAQFQIDEKTVLSKVGGQYGGRGITVAVIDPNTGIRLSESRTFDTWVTAGYGTNTFANTRALLDYINSLPAGTVMAIAIEDEGGFTSDGNIAWSNPIIQEAYQTFEALGSTKVRQAGYHSGWAMIVKKGPGGGVLAENVSAANTPVTITAQLSLTLNPDAGRRPASLSAVKSLAEVPEVNTSAAATPVISVTSQTSGLSSFAVDGKTIFRRPDAQLGGREIHVVAIDPRLGARSGSVRDFDTDPASKSGAGALATYIDSFDKGTIFAISMVKDDGKDASQSSSGARDVSRIMRSLGSTKIGQMKSQSGWAMVAVKGQGVFAEAYSDPRMPLTIQAQLPLALNSDAGRR